MFKGPKVLKRFGLKTLLNHVFVDLGNPRLNAWTPNCPNEPKWASDGSPLYAFELEQKIMGNHPDRLRLNTPEARASKLKKYFP